MRFSSHSRLWTPAAMAVGLSVALTLGTRSAAQSGSGVPSVVELTPATGAVFFEQVAFDYAGGIAAQTDWAQCSVDPRRLRTATAASAGYVNVFVRSTALRQPSWVIENLSIPARTTSRIGRYFDLRPGVVGQGPVSSLSATVLFSTKPLPNMTSVLDMAGRLGIARFIVQQTMHNAEGNNGEDPERASDRPERTVLDPVKALGQPPQPQIPPAVPTLSTILQEFQLDQPNQETAKNQCVPMAYANVLQYLENRYRISLGWTLAHTHVPGYGERWPCGPTLLAPSEQAVPDPYWFPVPEHSLVANIDAQCRRKGVCSCSTGSGTSSNGFFRYVAAFGNQAPVVLTHQGGSDPQKVVAGIVSTRVGAQPTWQWIFQQLQDGRGVYLSYCRYDDNGKRTGGHAVRVWGAEAYNGKFYLCVLDDGSQGCGTGGTRNRHWEVGDSGRPGGGGPNGVLNIDGNDSREITGVRAIEARPVLPFTTR